ncbi:MAG: 4Fe-4S binding protein [Candidatus Magnetomorum sp.]|nr:4Fe-4S binding protein [Candidatus Magnetomorum sp.]
MFQSTIIRRISQIFFLLLFLFLFRNTDYPGQETIPYAVNLFFCWNPLIAVSVMLIAKTVMVIFLPAIGIVVLTIIFGRVFCSWMCPLGTLLDMFQRFIPGTHTRGNTHFPDIRYSVFILTIMSALAGLQLVGFVDPFSILFRGLTFVVDPLMNIILVGFFDYLYLHAPEWISGLSEPVYQALKKTILPYQCVYFLSVSLSFCILFVIFSLEIVDRRFWCKKICPLGALFSILSRFSLLKRSPKKMCATCNQCATMCRMGSFDPEGHHLADNCSRCMECVQSCPQDRIGFHFKFNQKAMTHTSISRRHFVSSTMMGAILPLINTIDAQHKQPHPYLLRPPGAQEENIFQDLCVRCGECMKVCITNALQPTLLESGWTGLFVPQMIPRLGYCEFNCHLCGQVCPTGAIQQLNMDQKHQAVIGKAYFDKNRCLPYAQQTSCIVCEEHCPVYNKAIHYDTVRVKNKDGNMIEIKQPYVVEDRCIGCGICENKCPISGEAAIRVMVYKPKKFSYNLF